MRLDSFFNVVLNNATYIKISIFILHYKTFFRLFGDKHSFFDIFRVLLALCLFIYFICYFIVYLFFKNAVIMEENYCYQIIH